MRKVVLVLLLILFGVSATLGITKYMEYQKEPKENNNVKEIEKQIKEVEVEIKTKEEEITKAKKDNKDVLKEIEEWQKKIDSIKKYFG